MHPVFSTFKHGKLLLSGEYAVLDGATALALPVRYGQYLTVYHGESDQAILQWFGSDHLGHDWLEARYSLPQLNLLAASNEEAGLRLQQLLIACRNANADFLNQNTPLHVSTIINFPREWGLGTSSTLVAAVAEWANVDPYTVLDASFGGSGYDVACANADGPILYQRYQQPRATPVHFQPDFTEHLYFIYQGHKQDSREGIRTYRAQPAAAVRLQPVINRLTTEMLEAKDLETFCRTLAAHERAIAAALDLTPVQQRFFADFEGAVKSLGAWGGDFVLAATPWSKDQVIRYFSEKGFITCVPYEYMVLDSETP